MNSPDSVQAWHAVCTKDDLIPNSGVCALVQGHQIALFYLPDESPDIYAVGNWDPIGEANVISRGILGSVKGELVVASPMFKQHFSLISGLCLEDESQRISVYPVKSGNEVKIQVSA